MAQSTASIHYVRPDVTQPVKPDDLPPHPYTFPLDPFQQHAMVAIAKEENVLVCAKTGSGKTLVGEYQIEHSLAKGKRVFYTTPIKSLSNQKFHDLKHLYGDRAMVGIMTGDMKFCPTAQLVVMTTEILRNLLYKRGSSTEHLGITAALSMDAVDAVIFDECHYLNDRNRGSVWEETMILLPPEVRMVMLSATLDHPEELADWLTAIKGVPVHLIETTYRIVPLTHYVMDRTPTDELKMTMIMDAKEKYLESNYRGWLQKRQRVTEEARAYQRTIASGQQPPDLPKRRDHAHYVQQLNDTIQWLETKEMVPALFFVLNRRACESYAHAITRSLLDVADASAVKHILSFHLHPYRALLDPIPHYHLLCDLLCKGIAFHHSGVLPILKEMVELLFSKGYVKVLFCTETFAVGLNMPTKTVVFAGLKKYDEDMEGMRLLRKDEYMQMAGRAGRRGKDDRGIVVYLPSEDPLSPHELGAIFQGPPTTLTSHMPWGEEFVLKALANNTSTSTSTGGWHSILEQSYWHRLATHLFREQSAKEVIERQTVEQLRGRLTEEQWRGCEARAAAEDRIHGTVNAERRQAQQALDRIKNSQVGPKWADAWLHYRQYHEQVRTLDALHAAVEEARYQMEGHPVKEVIQRLRAKGFVEETAERLTLKGILASEVNEVDPLMLTEWYLSVSTDPTDPTDLTEKWMAVLVGMMEEGEEWIEPMKEWHRGRSMGELCTEYKIFEGNMMRMILSFSNVIEEVITMATYAGHPHMVQWGRDLQSSLVHQRLITDSLYVHRLK